MITAKRVGLVLAGGGGKGAYQIGCWAALRSFGVSRFHVISGASVGALNAALIAMGDLQEARRLWEELSEEQVFFNPGGAWRLRIFGAALYFLTVMRLPFTFSWRKSWQSTAVGLSEWWHIGSNRPLRRLIRQYVSLRKLQESRTLIYCTESLYDRYYNPYLPFYVENAEKPVGHVGGMTLYERELDPEQQHWPTAEWLPHVTELTSLRRESDVVTTLLRSASLPLLFKRQYFSGRRSTDGGIADNVPMYPAIKDRCDLIIVVYLDHKIVQPTNDALRKNFADEHFRRDVLAKLSSADANRLYGQFCEIGFPDRPKPPFLMEERQFVFVVPSRPLGSIVDFTGGERVRNLIDLGYEDTEKALESFVISDCRHG